MLNAHVASRKTQAVSLVCDSNMTAKMSPPPPLAQRAA